MEPRTDLLHRDGKEGPEKPAATRKTFIVLGGGGLALLVAQELANRLNADKKGVVCVDLEVAGPATKIVISKEVSDPASTRYSKKLWMANTMASWHERHTVSAGKNENTNGRIKRVLPKRTDLGTVSKADIARIVHMMNHTVRNASGGV